MLCRTIVAVLLVSGFYTDAQLYAAKRVMVQCAALHRACGKDLGWLDREGRFHPVQRP
jgi:hypothetical protein